MKYVPDLIPEKSRPKIDFGVPEISETKFSIWLVLSTVAAVIFFLAALASIFFRFWEGVLFVIIGATLLPQGHRWIERALRFNFTLPIKGVFLILLFVILIPVNASYDRHYHIEQAKADAERKRVEEEARQEKLAKEKAEQERLDSLNFHVSSAIASMEARRYKSAAASYSSALRFTFDQDELLQKRADCYLKAGLWNNAISDFTTVIGRNYKLSDNYFNRAQCYNKAGRRAEAVADLKQAMSLGNAQAEALYEKINPLKRRVSYYVTRCCDGTSSNAKGRGACSHHGGVCNWNDPVYQEYRDY